MFRIQLDEHILSCVVSCSVASDAGISLPNAAAKKRSASEAGLYDAPLSSSMLSSSSLAVLREVWNCSQRSFSPRIHRMCFLILGCWEYRAEMQRREAACHLRRTGFVSDRR